MDLPPQSERMHVVTLDATHQGGIASALRVAGFVDALVNSAGIGVIKATSLTTRKFHVEWREAGKMRCGMAHPFHVRWHRTKTGLVHPELVNLPRPGSMA